jgi:hypothetical protein
MAVMVSNSGRSFTTRQLKAWRKQYEAGKRSKVDIERVELGDFTSRGKAITRLWAVKLNRDSNLVLR